MFWDIFSLTKRHKYRFRYREALNNTVFSVIKSFTNRFYNGMFGNYSQMTNSQSSSRLI